MFHARAGTASFPQAVKALTILQAGTALRLSLEQKKTI